MNVLKCLIYALMVSCIALSSCGKDDPCENISCVNGDCDSGICDCDEGWQGPDCNTPIDPCIDVTCINGDCVNGICACDEGWGGPNCNTPIDPCIGITCVNGDCINGNCMCDEGWEGLDCSVRKVPTNILISIIEINRFPEVRPDGTGWDISGGRPDLKIRIISGNNQLVYSQVLYQDATNNDDIIFRWIDLLDIGPVRNIIRIELYDGDVLSDDLIANISVQLYNDNDTGSFETVRVIENANLEVGLVIEHRF